MDESVPNPRSDSYHTPALERLAAAGAGMRFSNAYSPHPHCSPTRMSIQTGKSPARLGSTDIFYRGLYTSDNGGEVFREPTSNEPLRKGAAHTWEGGIRVPLVVRDPGIEAGSASDVPVNVSDFFATFAELLGIEAELPATQDSGSLVPILTSGGAGSVQRPTEDFVWYYPHFRNMKGVFP